MTNNISLGSTKPAWKKTSFWIAMAIWLLLLVPFLAVGGFGVWLVLFALFLIITALYSLILGRPSWMGLPHRKGAGGAIAGGVAALVVGTIMVPAAPIDSSAVQPFAALEAVATPSATPTPSATATPTPTPSPTARYVLLDPCATDGKSVTEGTASYICTPDDKGVLVWMKEKESKALVAERVEAKKVAEEKSAAEKAAAEKAATEQAAAVEAARVASEQAAAEGARVAAEQAAAAEAERIAAEQAAQPQAPAAPIAPAAYYGNCAEARAAGAAPMYVGQPGYRAGLDRGKDGIACDK